MPLVFLLTSTLTKPRRLACRLRRGVFAGVDGQLEVSSAGPCIDECETGQSPEDDPDQDEFLDEEETEEDAEELAEQYAATLADPEDPAQNTAAEAAQAAQVAEFLAIVHEAARRG